MKRLLAAAALSSPLLAAQEAPVPVDREPMHVVVLKNDYVEAMHVTIPPERSTMWHTHSHDGVAVRLSDAKVRVDRPGQDGEEAVVKPGDVSAPAYARQPMTHRVNNVGRTTFEVVDVEVLRRPDGPPTGPIATPAAENESARVYRWALDPGSSTPQHTHERPYLVVAATPVRLLMTAPDGAAMEHQVAAGDLHWVDRKVTHALGNRGPQAGVLVEVELK